MANKQPLLQFGVDCVAQGIVFQSLSLKTERPDLNQREMLGTILSASCSVEKPEVFFFFFVYMLQLSKVYLDMFFHSALLE